MPTKRTTKKKESDGDAPEKEASSAPPETSPEPEAPEPKPEKAKSEKSPEPSENKGDTQLFFSTDGCLCIENIVMGLMWGASKPGDEMYFVGSRGIVAWWWVSLRL